MIKLVLFDFDDTLICSGHAIIEHHRKISKMMGIRVPSYNEIAALLAMPWDRVLRRLWPDIDIDVFKKLYRANPKDNPLTLIDGAFNAINHVHNNYKIGLLTARDRKTTLHNLKKYNFPDFDFINTGTDKVTKPDPEVFSYILKHFDSITPKQTFYVGDALIDYECSKKTNVNFIAVLTGNVSRDEFMKAGVNIVLNSVKELPNTLKRMY